MRPVLISRCDGVEKPPKKTTPGEAAPGLEPGTSPMQSGALGAWPRCSINSGLNFICIVTARLIFSTNGRTAPIVNRPIGAQNRLSHCHTHKSGRNRCIGVSEKKCLQSSSLITVLTAGANSTHGLVVQTSHQITIIHSRAQIIFSSYPPT
jgi:hypothetical protein